MPNNASAPPGSDLFGSADEGVFTVSELTRGLRSVVEAEYGDVRVEGELSNFKRHTSGHCYFTLKDAGAQLRGVMWRHAARRLTFEPTDGLQVRIQGNASVYERRGDLQLLARTMLPAGEGALRKAFEALKRRLAGEGLFDEIHKRPLPPFPESVGVVTSGTGAALHDVLSILQRRFPHVRVLVCPVQVQGAGAAQNVADAVEAFNGLPPGSTLRPDVLIVGRGGGSVEDLWAFNEEVVARSVFASEIPVISAVGHETDFSIADFVADVRAATPSMAAELAVPDRHEVAAVVRGLHAALEGALRVAVGERRQRVRMLTGSHAFHRPVDRLHQAAQRLDDLSGRLQRGATQHVARARRRHDGLEGRLTALDPERPLRRGYVLVERDGGPVRRAAALSGGEAVTLHFHDGRRHATIDEDGSFQ